MSRAAVGTAVFLTMWIVLTGCSSGNRAEDLAARSLERVMDEADKLGVGGLERRATDYRDAILGQKTKMDRLRQEQAGLGYGDRSGPRAKELNERMKTVGQITSRLLERYQVYINKLHQKGISTKSYEL